MRKTIHIKGNKWIVKLKKNLKDSEGNKCSGLTHTYDRRIYLEADLDEDDMTWVFWHEYCHAMLYEAGITENTGGISPLAEEIICDNLAELMKKLKVKSLL